MVDDFPPSYDYFYIVKELLDTFPVEECVSKEEDFLGVLYFSEILLLDVISNVEKLLSNVTFYHMLHFDWNPDNRVSNNRTEDVFINYAFRLNELRKRLSSMRHKSEKRNREEIFDILESARNLCEEIDASFREDNDVNRRNTESSVEKVRVLSYIKNHFHRMEKERVYKDEKSFLPSDVQIAYPGGGYGSWQDDLRDNYDLRNKHEEIRKKLLDGYSVALASLYSCFGVEEVSDILEVTSWEELHGTKDIILDEPGSDAIFTPLFEVEENAKPSFVVPERIEDKEDAATAFMSSSPYIKVRKSQRRGDIRQRRSEFRTVFLGVLAQMEERPLLIEFETSWEDWTWYSYALRVPGYSAVANHTFWYYFHELGLENDVTPLTAGVYLARGLADKADVNFFQIKSDKEALEEFVFDNSPREKNRKNLESLFEDTKGLLGELLGEVYLQSKYDVSIETWHEETNNTDIDILAESKNQTFLLQAKSSFSPQQTQNVIDHFERLEETNDIDTKILFLLEPSPITDQAETEQPPELKEEIDESLEALEEKGINIVDYHGLLGELQTLGDPELVENLSQIFSYKKHGKWRRDEHSNL